MRLAAALLCAALTAACATTELKNSSTWHASGGAAPARRVLVVALSRDEQYRLRAEEALAEPLAKQGVEVHRGSDFSTSGRVLTPARLAEAVARLQPDAVLFTELRGVAEPQHYEPGGDDWLSYYGAVWDEYFGPGYHRPELVVRVSAELFGAERAEGLLWSSISEAFDPTTPSRGLGSAGRGVVRKLDQAGLL